MNIRQFLLDIFTEPNNNTVCVLRVAGIGGIVFALGAQAYSLIVHGTPFNIESFAIGYGALIGTLGVALGIKKDSA
jgi:hypothetical protein